MAATPIMEPQAAIIHYTRYLAQDLGSFGITANCIAPGVIVSTALSSRCLKDWWMDHFRRRSCKVYRSKHERDQQCSNRHDDAETGTNACRLSLHYLNTPTYLF